MKYILLTIDGTDSRNWRLKAGASSHCYNFNLAFRNANIRSYYRAKHLEGPDDVLLGSDSNSIQWQANNFLLQAQNELFPHHKVVEQGLRQLKENSGISNRFGQAQRSVTPYASREKQLQAEIADFYRERRRQLSSHKYLRVILIGHSRGGAICLEVAHFLRRYNIEVYFMGLFDAVDRSPYIDINTVKNTRFKYHAKRGKFSSRPYFGNTGALEEQFEEIFDTSHGGVGGALDATPSYGEDLSCSPSPMINYDTMRDAAMFNAVHAYAQGRSEAYKKRAQERWEGCKTESERAYTWMTTKAKSHEIRLH